MYYHSYLATEANKNNFEPQSAPTQLRPSEPEAQDSPSELNHKDYQMQFWTRAYNKAS